jgi:hypothetical protein
LNYAATAPKSNFHKGGCLFLINLPLFRVEICSGKRQNTISPPQNLFEHLFIQEMKVTSTNLSFSRVFNCQGYLAKPSVFYQAEFTKD